MTNNLFRSTCVAAAGVLSACAANRPPVAVAGAPQDVAQLAGEWVGDYSSAVTGRNGTISFTLSAAGDSAVGAVVMVPAGYGRPLAPWNDPARLNAGPPPTTQVLSIRFVRVRGGRVNGSLDPYADPQTGTRLTTTFVGTLVADTIVGTYATRPSAVGDEATGRWRVVRSR
ncbi:MAG TPA: hypothetical protein VNG95_03995 [Gemmatimonadales bacterium]|nr:hypothetical protein [Gemmatimonadales bacterium]